MIGWEAKNISKIDTVLNFTHYQRRTAYQIRITGGGKPSDYDIKKGQCYHKYRTMYTVKNMIFSHSSEQHHLPVANMQYSLQKNTPK